MFRFLCARPLGLVVLLYVGGGCAGDDQPTADGRRATADTGSPAPDDRAGDSDTGSGTDPACGDGVLDPGEECDGTAFGGETCGTRDPLAVDGTLGCTSACTVDDAGCVSASDWIAAVRASTEPTGASLPVAKAVVTNLQPALGDDPPGFFVQAEQAGPALFVDTSTGPAPVAIGDEVHFTVTGVARESGQALAVMGLADLAVDASGRDVELLEQDLSGVADVFDALDELEAELVTVEAGTLTSDVVPVGAAHAVARLQTSAVDDPRVELRLAADLADDLDLANGCVVDALGNVGRDEDTLQVLVLASDDLGVQSCPPPQVVSATAVDGTTVEVGFDRRIDGASLDLVPLDEDFVFNNGLAATAFAQIDDRTVRLTTTAQLEVQYTVTVRDVTDTRGAAIDPLANSATFTGIDADQPVLVETFDDDAAFTKTDPADGTAISFFSKNTGTDFFGITNGTTGGDFDGDPAPDVTGKYTGFTGNFFVAQDLDGFLPKFPAGPKQVALTWSGIDVSGLASIGVEMDLAEAEATFDTFNDIDPADYIDVYATLDGTEVTVAELRSSIADPKGFNGVWRVDTTGDGVGDGTEVTDTAKTFAFSVQGTGATMDLTIEISVDAGDEDIAIDNLTVGPWVGEDVAD